MVRRRTKTLVFVFISLVALLMTAVAIDPNGFRAVRLAIERQLVPQKPVSQRLAKAGFEIGQPVLIRIFKEESQLELWMQRTARFEKVWSFPICKWSGALGPKLKEGDRQSPEGYYFASAKQLLPTSRHHRAINTGFPNSFDQSLGRTGTVLMIHGSCSSIGCYAMTHPAIDDIYTVVEAALDYGQPSIPMHLYPFRMTNENLARHAASPWIEFWRNLSEGDALFTTTGQPPPVYACGSRYHFASRQENCQKVSAW